MLYLKKGTDHIQLAGFYFSYPDIIRDSSGFGRFGLQASVESAFQKKKLGTECLTTENAGGWHWDPGILRVRWKPTPWVQNWSYSPNPRRKELVMTISIF